MIGPCTLRGAATVAGEPGNPDVPAALPLGGGVVSRCTLFGRLAGAERVVEMSASAGSGKTVLVRSWLAGAGLARHAAWVPVDREVRDPRRFWISVADALRARRPDRRWCGR
jgi:LuxR family transcriptional regulator, maltose regulon positive regulatory protein